MRSYPAQKNLFSQRDPSVQTDRQTNTLLLHYQDFKGIKIQAHNHLDMIIRGNSIDINLFLARRVEGLMFESQPFYSRSIQLSQQAHYSSLQIYVHVYHYQREVGAISCLLHQSLKFNNNVFLFFGLTTLGTFMNFDWLVY